MPQPQVDMNDPAVIQELLRQKGLLASGGNIRMMPFANSSGMGTANASGGASNASPVSGTPTSPSGDIAVGPDGQPIVDRNGIPVPVGATDADVDPNLLPYIIGAAGAGTGGYLAKHLADRYRNRVRGVNGELIDDGMTPEVLPSEFEGQYTEVNDNAALTDQRTKTISSDKPAVAETLAQQRAPKSTAQVTAPKAGTPRTQVTSGSTIKAKDAYTDVAPDEMKKVQSIVDELVRNRQTGNAMKKAGRAVEPTGPIGREGILNSVIKVLRDNKALKSLTRAAR